MASDARMSAVCDSSNGASASGPKAHLVRLMAKGLRGESMTTEEITLRVSPEAARAFRQASPEEQLRLETLVSLQLIG
jgi:flagellar biosynthesis/type III secretory pathway protein FliH